ncbi:PucR family transcriptional regulator [Paenibacillus taiwanensis]|uniref:PucR family transcriptional regulator n=1 Tax=Paenibacillus taiwanensis TaxID=401638 RepID=UPI000413EF58|nr:helix-turn-helix domain-containing protein [Paenibacillus taiwanensis]
MDKQNLREQIERIINVPLDKKTISTATWKNWVKSAQADGQSTHVMPPSLIVHEDQCYMLWKQGSSQTDLLHCASDLLSERERQWLETLLWLDLSSRKSSSLTTGGDEQQAVQFGQWIVERLQAKDTQAEVPDSFSWKTKMFAPVIPFLLVAEHSHREGPSYAHLYKLLKSYFGGELVIFPLSDKEWCILVPESLASSGEQDEDPDNKETMEEMLTSFCLGLYELLAAEWVGESNLTVAYPFTPVKGIPSIVSRMRETIYLGRTFHITENIHLPWELHLEQLVYSIPDEVRKQFMKRVVTKTEQFGDSETMGTLQTFFQYDCSVSETAKRLYIHRNTLLYRLDKIKQETGLDVRSFSDAVLVKLILLLYKVTK